MPWASGIYTKFKDFANGGTLLPGDLDGIQEEFGERLALKTIRGRVSSLGVGPLDGTGFTSERTELGTYEITFTTPFSGDWPTVVVTAYGSVIGAVMASARITEVSGDAFTVVMSTETGEEGQIDTGFMFIATGPA